MNKANYFLLVLLSMLSVSFAQETTIDKTFLKKYKTKTFIGKVMFVGGLTSLGTGTYLLSSQGNNYSETKNVAGIVCSSLGAISTAGGIVFLELCNNKPFINPKYSKTIGEIGIFMAGIGGLSMLSSTIISSLNEDHTTSVFNPQTQQYELVRTNKGQINKEVNQNIMRFGGIIAVSGGIMAAYGLVNANIEEERQERNLTFELLPNSIYIGYRF